MACVAMMAGIAGLYCNVQRLVSQPWLIFAGCSHGTRALLRRRMAALVRIAGDNGWLLVLVRQGTRTCAAAHSDLYCMQCTTAGMAARVAMAGHTLCFGRRGLILLHRTLAGWRGSLIACIAAFNHND